MATAPTTTSAAANRRQYMQLLVASYICMFIGSFSSSLLSKFYFIHKGSNRWVSTWIQSVGFPLLLFPAYLPFYSFGWTTRKPFTRFTRKLLLLSSLIGLLFGVNNLLISYGNSYLPVSTSSLLMSSQLAFTLILSALIVKQRITFNNVNCVILLTLSSILLSLGSDSDKSKDLTKLQYFIGFATTIGAGLMFACYLPVMELVYREVDCYAMVVEMQLIMLAAATVFATVGMAAGGGFAAMRKESRVEFDLGEKAYWWSLWGNAVTWQLCFMGTAGMIFMTTSLTSGICMTALLSVNVLGGVVVYKDNFGGVKALSTVLCLWGFSSYIYGLYGRMRKEKEEEQKVIRTTVNGGGGGNITRGPTVEMGAHSHGSTVPDV